MQLANGYLVIAQPYSRGEPLQLQLGLRQGALLLHVYECHVVNASVLT